MEQLRLLSVQNEVGLERLTSEGIEVVEFTEEIRALREKFQIEKLLPTWVNQVGGADAPIIQTYNDKVGPWMGLRIEPDGSVSKVPITKR